MAGERIMIIEDDRAILELLDAILTEEGYQTILWTQGEDAHPLMRATQPALVILDLRLETPDAGRFVLDQMEHDPSTSTIPVIICSGYVPIHGAEAEAFRHKGYRVLNKPFHIKTLLATAHDMIQRSGTVKAYAREVGGESQNELTGPPWRAA